MKKMPLIIFLLIISLSVIGCGNDNPSPPTGPDTTPEGTPKIPLSSDLNTVAIWHCNEGQGQTANDASANSNSLTLNGAVWNQLSSSLGLVFST